MKKKNQKTRIKSADQQVAYVARQLNRLMEKNKISKKELARRLDKGAPQITRMLNGTRNFTIKTLAEIAEALELRLVIRFRED